MSGGTLEAGEPPVQPELFLSTSSCPALAPTAPSRPEAVDECPEGVAGTVDCAVGCRGTSGCLCGQGELSDYPVWIEND